jgi:hypothetical protein
MYIIQFWIFCWHSICMLFHAKNHLCASRHLFSTSWSPKSMNHTFYIYSEDCLGVSHNFRSTWQIYNQPSAPATLQRKSHFCIPRKGIAGPQSQFQHLCVCERFIYSQDRSTYLPAAEKADWWWEYINRSQTHECGNWDWGCAIHFFGIFVSNFWYCVFAVQYEERFPYEPSSEDLGD